MDNSGVEISTTKWQGEEKLNGASNQEVKVMLWFYGVYDYRSYGRQSHLLFKFVETSYSNLWLIDHFVLCKRL